MSKFVTEVTDSSFEQDVLRSTRPVLVNYWADWCVECRVMSQIVNALAEEYADSVTVANLNVDESPGAAGSNCIRMIPTLILFNAGKELERIEGVTSKGHLSRTIDKHKASKVAASNNKSPYKILNVSEGASREEITIAYKQMAKLYHPDKVASLAPEFQQLAEMRMKEINGAYLELLDG